jgi:hypothetical protein
MAKKNSTVESETLPITSSELAAPASNSVGVKITSSAFDALGGEVFSGLNILKLSEGEAAGPFRFLRTVEQEMPAKGKKPAQIVTCYVAEHIVYPGREIRLPLAASFVKKCEDAAIKKGDILAVRRGGDYVDKTYRQTCQGFDLKVMARAGEAAKLAEIAKAYPVAS